MAAAAMTRSSGSGGKNRHYCGVSSARLLWWICIVGILTTAVVNLGLSSLWHSHSLTNQKQQQQPHLLDSSLLSSLSTTTKTKTTVAAAAAWITRLQSQHQTASDLDKSRFVEEDSLNNDARVVDAIPNTSNDEDKKTAQRSNSTSNGQTATMMLEKMVERDVRNPDKYFSACLLIKDDNDLLNEWIAYHYHTLKLRYLVLAVDPNSLTSPTAIVQKWQNLTDLQVLEWSDRDFMSASFLQKGYVIPLDRIDGNASNSKWHLGHEDEQQVKLDKQRITNHRFRQLTFLSSCYRHLRENKKSWVLHIDTDEHVSLNPILRIRGKNGQLPIPKDLREPMVLFRFLSAIRYRPRLKTNSNFPCISMPRLLYGAHVAQKDSSVGLVHGIFNASKFETLHWKYHTSLVDRERNALPKVIVDVSVVNETDEMFKRKAFSIHRPSKKLCRFVDQMDFAKIQSFPFSVNHYLGSWERYMSRNDSRRSLFAYQAKASVKDGRDDWVSTWIDGFLDSVDANVARELLRDYV